VLLALTASAHAQDPSPYVKHRVEIDAPLALADALRSGLDLYRWQGYETMTPELLARLMTEAEVEARDIVAANGYFSPTVKATLDTATDPQVVATIGRAGSPIEYLDAPEFQAYWSADAKLMTEAVQRIGKVE